MLIFWIRGGGQSNVRYNMATWETWTHDRKSQRYIIFYICRGLTSWLVAHSKQLPPPPLHTERSRDNRVIIWVSIKQYSVCGWYLQQRCEQMFRGTNQKSAARNGPPPGRDLIPRLVRRKKSSSYIFYV